MPSKEPPLRNTLITIDGLHNAPRIYPPHYTTTTRYGPIQSRMRATTRHSHTHYTTPSQYSIFTIKATSTHYNRKAYTSTFRPTQFSPTSPHTTNPLYTTTTVIRQTTRHPGHTPPTHSIISASTPRQTDGWSCCMHMLLINLTTIYQGTFPTFKHSQSLAHTFSRYHPKYTLTGILDPHIENIVKQLTNATTTKKDSRIAPLNSTLPQTQHSEDPLAIKNHQKRTYVKTTRTTIDPHTIHQPTKKPQTSQTYTLNNHMQSNPYSYLNPEDHTHTRPQTSTDTTLPKKITP
jgi:hypothetical protein